MTDTEDLALDRALIRAAERPEERPEFYRLLLESNVYVLGRTQHGEQGTRTAMPGETVSLAHFEKADGSPYLPVFTCRAALEAKIEGEQSCLNLPGRTLLEMTLGKTLIVFASTGHAKEFFPEEISALISTGVNQAAQTRVVAENTRVMLGAPADYPHEMVRALAAFLRTRPAVKEARLCLMVSDGPSLVVGFRGGRGLKEAMREAGSIASDTAPRGTPVDFIDLAESDDGLSKYLSKSSPPFYRRSLATSIKAALRL